MRLSKKTCFKILLHSFFSAIPCGFLAFAISFFSADFFFLGNINLQKIFIILAVFMSFITIFLIEISNKKTFVKMGWN